MKPENQDAPTNDTLNSLQPPPILFLILKIPSPHRKIEGGGEQDRGGDGSKIQNR